MIYAIKHNKVKRAIFKGNEDSLTSSIFERLMYLPQEMLQHIFTTALFDDIEGLELNQIESISFWPNWNPEQTSNSRSVEPDVFIRTAKQDIIIEAKRKDEKQQDADQWKREIQAYNNEYSEDGKPLVFIALGGLHTNETEIVSVGSVQYDIYKCSWKSILNAIQDIIHNMELVIDFTNNNKTITKILKDMVLCFELFGFSSALWLERFISAPQIKQESINYFTTPWKN